MRINMNQLVALLVITMLVVAVILSSCTEKKTIVNNNYDAVKPDSVIAIKIDTVYVTDSLICHWNWQNGWKCNKHGKPPKTQKKCLPNCGICNPSEYLW